MTSVVDLVHSELHSAAQSLKESHVALVRLAQKNEGTPVGKFILRAMEWRADERKAVMLHSFLCRVMQCNTGFMHQLTAFVENSLLGSGGFSIVWVGGRSGDILPMKDSRSRPAVIDQNGLVGASCRNAALLLEAMDLLEHRESERDAQVNALEGLDDA